MIERQVKHRIASLKPLLLLGLLVILPVAAWFAWKSLPATFSDSRTLPGSTVERVYLGPPNSLAVLSFTAGGDGKTPPYLAPGVARVLVDLLASEPNLQLTAATSSLFPGPGMDNREIVAQRLRVGHVLSGTVELKEERILVRASLWDARRKEVSWTSSWDRDLEQAARLPVEVSRAVLEQLPITTGQAAQVASEVSPQAWMAYLRGREAAVTGPAGEAKRHLSRAVELHPEYLEAQLELARLALSTSPIQRDEAVAIIDAILQQDPGCASALGLRSHIERNFDWNWAAAVDSATRAIGLLPGDAALLNLAGQAMFSVGRHGEAVDHFHAAVVRDPLNLNIRLGLGLAQEYLGQYDEALKTYRVLLGLNADYPAAHAFRARIKLLQENPDSALRESEQESDRFWKDYSRVMALTGQHKPQEAVALWNEMIASKGEVAAFQFAEIAAYMGRADDAFAWLDSARRHRDGGMRELRGNRFLEALHDDPRWQELLTKMGLALDADRPSD